MTAGPFDRDDTLDAALRSLFAERPAPEGEHPTPDELLDYHLRALPPEDEDRVEEHLAGCAECARLVLDFAVFSDPGTPPAPHPALRREATWKKLQERLAASPLPASPGPAHWWRTPAPAWGLAAASLLLAVGLLVWGLSLRLRLQQVEEPRTDVAFAALAPREQVTERAGERVRQVFLPRGTGRLALTLTLGEVRSFPSYRMELLAANGITIWRASGVTRGADGTFALELPARRLPSNTYRVRLYGRSADRTGEELLAEYAFEAVRTRTHKSS